MMKKFILFEFKGNFKKYNILKLNVGYFVLLEEES